MAFDYLNLLSKDDDEEKKKKGGSEEPSFDYLKALDEKEKRDTKLMASKVDFKDFMSNLIPAPKVDTKPAEYTSFDKMKDDVASILNRNRETGRVLDPRNLEDFITLHGDEILQQRKAEVSQLRESTSPFVRNFAAGVGDVTASVGGVMRWAGNEEWGKRVSDIGRIDQGFGDEQKPITWRSVVTPEFWNQTVPRTLPFALSLMPLAILGSYAGTETAAALGLGSFGKTVMGAIGYSALTAPAESALEAGSVYDQALQKGMTEEEADAAANKTFWKNLGLTAGMNAAEFAAAFIKIPGAKTVVGKILRGAGRLGVNALQEGGEEVVQELISSSSLGEKATPEQLLGSFITGGVMGLGFGSIGEAKAIFNDIQAKVVEKMSDTAKAQYNQETRKNFIQGMSEEQARVVALDEYAETREGKKNIKEVVTAVKNDMVTNETESRAAIEKASGVKLPDSQSTVASAPVKPAQVSPDAGAAAQIETPAGKAAAQAETVEVDRFDQLINKPDLTKQEASKALREIETRKLQLMRKLEELKKKERTPAIAEKINDITKSILKIDLQKFALKEKSGQTVSQKIKEKILETKQKFEQKIEELKVAENQKRYEQDQAYRKKIDGIRYVDWWKRSLDKQEAKEQQGARLKEQKEKLQESFSQKEAEQRKKLNYKLKEKKEEAVKRYKTKQKEKFKASREKAKQKAEARYTKRRMTEKIKKLDLKHMRPEYKTQIEAILQDIDYTVTKRSQKKLDRLTKLRQYVQDHPDNNIPESKLKELELLSKKTIGDLTDEEFKTIYESIMHLAKLEQLKNKMIFGKRYRDANEVIGKAISNLLKKDMSIKKDPDLIDTTLREKESSTLKKIFTVDSYNPEMIAEILDRDPKGIIKEVMYDGIDQGISDQLAYQQEVEDMFREAMKGFEIDGWSEAFNKKKRNVDYVTVDLPGGSQIRFTRAERIAFYLQAKNRKNVKHILNGGFSFESSKSIIHRIHKDDLDTIINSLSDNERKVADIVYNFFNDFQKKKLNQVSVELNGWEIATEKDYFPIRTNAIDIKRDALRPKNNFVQNTLEGMGILKERVNAGNALIIEDVFKAVYTSMKKTSAYYGLAAPLRNAKMLLNNKAFRQNVNLRYGSEYWEALNNYINDIESTAIKVDNVDKLTGDLINKLDVSILGANPWVVLKQPTSYILGATEIDLKYLVKAIKKKPDFNEIRKYSPQLRDRLDGNVSVEKGELGDIGAVKAFFTGKASGSQKLTDGIRLVDNWTIGRTWEAVKMYIKETQPSLQGDAFLQAVAKKTEEIVRHTQSVSQLKDRSALGRKKETGWRLFTRFTSQRNTIYNGIRRSILRYDISPKTLKDKGKLMKNLFLFTVVSSMMVSAVDSLRDKLYGRKEEDKRPWALKAGIKIIGDTLGYAYIVGDAFNSIVRKIEKGSIFSYDMNNPLESFAQDAINAVVLTHQTIDQVITEERYKSGPNKGKKKFKITAWKAIDKAAATAGGLTAFPYNNIKRLIEGIYKKFFKKEP
jgi:hypothetical protein